MEQHKKYKFDVWKFDFFLGNLIFIYVNVLVYRRNGVFCIENYLIQLYTTIGTAL